MLAMPPQVGSVSIKALSKYIPLDDPPSPNLKPQRLSPVIARVEFASVTRQCASIMHFNRIALDGFAVAVDGAERLDLESGICSCEDSEGEGDEEEGFWIEETHCEGFEMAVVNWLQGRTTCGLLNIVYGLELVPGQGQL